MAKHVKPSLRRWTAILLSGTKRSISWFFIYRFTYQTFLLGFTNDIFRPVQIQSNCKFKAIADDKINVN